MSGDDEVKLRLNQALDQWIARIREGKASGEIDTWNAMTTHVGKMCGVDMTATDTVSTRLQPLVIFVAAAIERLLAAEERLTPRLLEDPDPYG